MTHRAVWCALMLPALGCAQDGRGSQPARPGIDVLLTDSVSLIAGRRVGLLTNQTGVDRAGNGDLERLLAANVQVSAIFSPEHGYRGLLDRENIAHGIDSATGIPIYSLYGAVRAPTSAMLASVTVLVIDLQDIGARPYTYISTTLLAMRAAGDAGVPVVVLDRPNPLGGVAVQGPVLDPAFGSFVGMLPVAIRHGMTLGELARLGNEVLRIGADLRVVPVAEWRREHWFDDTRLPWIRPSPNMPNLESATHYPGVVLFEATNLSVGRGTGTAFQVIGSPWLRTADILAAVGPQPGVAFSETVIRPVAPSDGKYAGVAVPAIRLAVTDRKLYDPTVTAVALLVAIRAVQPESLLIDVRRLDQLAGTDRLRVALLRGDGVATIRAGWEEDLEAFGRLRGRYLLYE